MLADIPWNVDSGVLIVPAVMGGVDVYVSALTGRLEELQAYLDSEEFHVHLLRGQHAVPQGDVIQSSTREVVATYVCAGLESVPHTLLERPLCSALVRLVLDGNALPILPALSLIHI